MDVNIVALQRSKNFTQPAPEKYEFAVDDHHAHHALQITRWQLKLLGIWPQSLNSSCFEKILTTVTITICSLLLMFIIVPGSLFTYIKIKDMNVRIKLIGALSFCVMAILKYSSLLISRQDIGNCIEHLMFDWKKNSTVNDRTIMTTFAEYGRWSSIICAIFMYGGGIFYAVILPCVSPSVQNEQNDTIKPLAYPSYYVWIEPQNDITYIIIFSTHCCCAVVMHAITSTACSIAVVFSMHACGQLKIVTSPLNELINQTSHNDRVHRILPKVIQHHSNTLRFINKIEKILNKICLVEVGGCTLNICFLGYYFLLEWENSDALAMLTYIILLMSFIFNIFLFCYIGDLLTDECYRVGDSLYMIDWLKMSEDNVRQLILILIKAQHPATITAGKFIDLSLANFGAVIRTAATYLSFLRKFME